MGIFSILYTTVSMEIAQLHWEQCFKSHSWNNLPSTSELVVPAIGAIFEAPLLLVLQIAAGLPYLLILALTRSKVLGGIAMFVLSFGPATSIGSPMHSCDRKGCDVCSDLLLFQLEIFLPLGIVMLAFIAIGKAFTNWRERNASKIIAPQSRN